jgi:hypothetical protein
MLNKTIEIKGKTYMTILRTINEYGTFELFSSTDAGDYDTHFFRVKEIDGKIEYEDVDGEVLEYLKKIFCPKDTPLIY